MKNIVFLYSPLDALYLNVSVHSLFIVSAMSECQILLGLREGDNEEVTNLAWNLKEHLALVGPTSSLHESLERCKEFVEDDTRFLLTQPGAVFLREGILGLINEMFDKDPELGLVFGDVQIVQEEESTRTFPSSLNPMIIRGDIFKALDFSDIPDIGIGAFLSHEVKERNLRELHHKDIGIYTYPSCLSGVLWDDIQVQWKEALHKLKLKKGERNGGSNS